MRAAWVSSALRRREKLTVGDSGVNMKDTNLWPQLHSPHNFAAICCCCVVAQVVGFGGALWGRETWRLADPLDMASCKMRDHTNEARIAAEPMHDRILL